jgi:hypothetical protein
MNAHDSIEKLMEGYNPHQQLLEQTRGLVKKWKPTGLLEGLNGENETHGMSVLLENQARQLISEASSTQAGSSGTANKEEWSGVALPLVRKVFGEIASKDFVSVQPMNLPSGLVFYLNFKYGSTQPGFTAATSVHGTTNTANTDASGGLYGAGKFGYSINETVTGTFLTGSSISDSVAVTSSNAATWADTDYDAAYSASFSNYAPLRITQSAFTNADLNGVRAFEISGSAAGVLAGYLPQFTKFVNGSGAGGQYVQFLVSGSFVGTGADSTTVSVTYHKQPTDTTRGDFEVSHTVGADPEEANVGIPEIDVDMESVPIVAKTRKLKAVWTPELAQDLNAYHSVDAEAELTSMLSEYISMEIDLEILDMLIANASTTEYWSARVGYEYDSNNSSWIAGSDNASYAYTKNEWFQTLGNKIQRVSNKIHQKTMRGGANFLVCGPDVATILESIPGFNVNTDGNVQQFAMGVQQVGTLANRFTVYKNPYMLENTILCGFRGTNFLETGAVYAPYIPLIMTPLIYDPTNFTPRKGVMTRYAKKIVRPEFYGKIIVADANFV